MYYRKGKHTRRALAMKKTLDYTEHRNYRFRNTTTLEDLGSQMDVCYDTLM